MTKNEMINAVAEKLDGITKKDITTILETYGEVVLETISEDITNKVPLLGIGAFTGKTVPERRGTSTLGGTKEWVVPEHDELTFKISKGVKTII